jgi:hypothetical protein
MAGENSEGLFKPEIKEDENNPKHEEVDESAKVKQGEVGKPQGKYAKKFIEDITKNPNDYKVQTPKGEMTIAEAIRKGYNPITKQFDATKSPEEIKKKHMEGLNEADRAKLEELTSPSAARMAPKDAQAMGLPAESPMIAGQATPPEATPEQAMPAGPQPGGQPEGEMNIASMLGGAA